MDSHQDVIIKTEQNGLLSADNGLINVNGVVKLGGSLTQPTVLIIMDINTFAIKGLGIGDTL